MAELTQITNFLDSQLEPGSFRDASLNGLQIEGAAEVTKVAVAVDGALETVRAAADNGAQLLIVHHGLFWGKPKALVHSHKQVVQTAFDAGLSLYASHLPLDAHATYGNNALLAGMLELANTTPAFEYEGSLIGCIGDNGTGLQLGKIIERLASLPGGDSSMLRLSFGPDTPKRIGICSGSAADCLYRFAEDGFDTLITGEAKQFAYHFCREHGLNAVFAGHYATETVGVQALGKAVSEKFGTTWEFIDHPTGI